MYLYQKHALNPCLSLYWAFSHKSLVLLSLSATPDIVLVCIKLSSTSTCVTLCWGKAQVPAPMQIIQEMLGHLSAESNIYKRTHHRKGHISCFLSLSYRWLLDNMEEELGSIWTALIMAGLSAALEAKRFNSSVAEEKRICHKSLGVPWWWQGLLEWNPGLMGRCCSLSWPSELWGADVPANSRWKNIALHCNMPR